MKRVARSNLSTAEGLLRRWWVQKYQLPPTSDEYGRYTLEELWVEFYEDYFDKDPNAAFDELDADENVRFVTGDEEFDDLERRITEGTISDEEISEILLRWEGKTPKTSESTQDTAIVEDIGEGFDDTYSR